MKKVFATALCGVLALTAYAQNSIVNNPDNQGYFGIRASLDIACPGQVKYESVGVDTFKPGAGFSVGAIYNLPLVANLYFEPGVNLYYNTYALDNIEVIDEDLPVGIDVTGSMRKFGMRIPLQFGYHFDFTPQISLAVFTGPELEVGFSGRQHMKFKAGKLTESQSDDLYGDDGMSRFDLLWKFGAGLTFSHNYYLGVGGGVGMLNVSGDSDIKFHENLVQVTLGYNF